MKSALSGAIGQIEGQRDCQLLMVQLNGALYMYYFFLISLPKYMMWLLIRIT